MYVFICQYELLFRSINVDSGEALECVDWHKGDQSVELLGAVFILVTLTVKTDTDAVLNVTDTTFPDGLVQARVDADI